MLWLYLSQKSSLRLEAQLPLYEEHLTMSDLLTLPCLYDILRSLDATLSEEEALQGFCSPWQAL